MFGKISILVFAAFCSLTFTGCGASLPQLWATEIKIIPDPIESTVRVDGQPVGSGIVEVELPDAESVYTVEVCGPPGYFCHPPFTVRGDTERTVFNVPLQKDLSYDETISVDVANKFVRVPAAGGYSHEEAWQKLISCVTDAYSDLETLDSRSGYLTTAWKVKDYGFSQRQAVLRSRMVASIDNATPLQYKVKLEMQSFAGGNS